MTFDPEGYLHAGASVDRCLVLRLEDWKTGRLEVKVKDKVGAVSSEQWPRVCGFGSVALGLRGFGASGLEVRKRGHLCR